MTLRKRCLVLRQIEHLQNHGVTLDGLCERLPELSREDVQKAVYNLLSQDRIRKRGDKALGASNRLQFIYIVNPEWNSAKTAKRKKAVGRQSYTEALQTNSVMALGTVRYRDRKIKLLLSFLDKTHGTDRDLLIGLLADLGFNYNAAMAGSSL